MNNPLVSIIIPTYNRAHLISETLDSVLAQTYQNWECIIVDDGSTDSSENVIREYVKKDSRFQFYKRPVNKVKGASSCRNFGLSNVNGEYIIFLDSDDLLITSCLEGRVVKIQQNKSRNFWVFPMMIQNKSLKKAVQIPDCNDYLIEFLSCRIHWGIMCTIWDTQFLKSINGFNPLYPRLNDPEIHIKAMLFSNSNFIVFNDYLSDSIYKEALIKDYNAYAKNYFNSLLLFIPDVTKQLVEWNKKKYIVLLKNYLNHYCNDFKQNTKWKDMIYLFSVFYKCRVITLAEYFNRLISFLVFKIGRTKFNFLKK